MICKTIKWQSSDMVCASKILKLLPDKYTFAYDRLSEYRQRGISEIRLRAGLPCSFTVGNENIVMTDEHGCEIRSSMDEISEIIRAACEDSVYSHSNQIKDGFISYCGTRIGLCGSGSCVDGEYIGQRNITSLSIRIPVYAPDAADVVLDYVREKGFSKAMGILAVSAPNCGKTTFLRAFASRISNTSGKGFAKRICIIDERGELYNKAMMSSCLCDVISGVPKLIALEMAIRTMSPQVVVFDEIGNERETELLCNAYSGGVYVAASVHGNGISDIMYGKGIRNAFSKGVFSTVYLMKENAANADGEIIDMSGKVTV